MRVVRKAGDRLHGDGQPDVATLEAARGGDRRALDRLIAECLPLVYNVVGWSLAVPAVVEDVVEDVVRETLLHVVRGLSGLREPEGFRTWTVAAAVRLVRDRRGAVVSPAADRLVPDFVDLTVTRLGLSGQQREVAEATRWLEPEDRDVLSVWWLAAATSLSRTELAACCGITPQHAVVRMQRMNARLDAARIAIRAMAASPRCAELWVALGGWDGSPSPIWRKRIARHTRECLSCGREWDALAPSGELLAGLGMVPVPANIGAVAAEVSHPSVSHPTVVE
jgi:DNA-directed RNA polymerase specialized sigma24 family protein